MYPNHLNTPFSILVTTSCFKPHRSWIAVFSTLTHYHANTSKYIDNITNQSASCGYFDLDGPSVSLYNLLGTSQLVHKDSYSRPISREYVGHDIKIHIHLFITMWYFVTMAYEKGNQIKMIGDKTTSRAVRIQSATTTKQILIKSECIKKQLRFLYPA